MLRALNICIRVNCVIEQKKRLLEYERYLKRKGYQQQTIDRYISEVDLFYRKMKKKLNEETIRNYLAEMKVTNRLSSLIRIQSVLKNFYYFLYENELATIVEENQTLNNIKYIPQKDFQKLIKSILMKSNKSGKQNELHLILADRNVSIVLLMGKYGFTLNEVVNLNIEQINFYKRTIFFEKEQVILDRIDMDFLYQYFKSIPPLIRPLIQTKQSFFIAFDNKRMTYLWDYSTNSPKRLSSKAIQKMIKKVGENIGLSTISAQVLRNTAIIAAIKKGVSTNDLQNQFRLTEHGINRYIRNIKKSQV